eukprot:INCI5070.10.p1 GENE.INCI5070.10~~INCI5070.10.p1  ORF type:complete len:302 (+),score=61.66 INCI5070.10:36-908(+)
MAASNSSSNSNSLHDLESSVSDEEYFAGKVVVVTGGASGIGRGLCVAFAELGCNVVVADLNVAAAQAVAEEVSGLAVRCNCAVERDIRRLVRETEARVGPVDIFCANAGIPSNGGIDVTDDEWDLVHHVNVMQHVYVARQMIPRWKEREGGGHLVITASAAGLLTQVGALPYSVTKAAALSVAEWLAITHAEDGVNVSCICPQAVRSGMTGDTDGAVAGQDGMLEPSDVGACVVKAIRDGTFLILPHAVVQKYRMNKAKDHDRWIKSMGRLHQGFGQMILQSPNLSAAKL